MSKDVIIDFESLSTEPDAALLSMGIVVVDDDVFDVGNLNKSFDDIVSNGAHFKLKMSNQVSKYNRVVSLDTIDWWATQKDSAADILIPNKADIDLEDLPWHINCYLKDHGYTRGKCYTRGMIDSTWLQSLCRELKSSVNIEWWNYRDVRTFIDVLTGSSNGYLPKEYSFKPKQLIKHNALHDCALDAVQMYIAATISAADEAEDTSAAINFDDDIPF